MVQSTRTEMKKVTILAYIKQRPNPRSIKRAAVHRNSLKEDIQIILYKVSLQQISERESLPKLKVRSKFIKLKDKKNGIIEELLEEDESVITDINNLIHVAITIIIPKLYQPNKRSKNRRNVECGK